MPFDLFSNKTLHISLILLLGLVAYSNTLDVPFQWDELTYITGNPVVDDFAMISNQDVKYTHFDAVKKRPVGYFTFFINKKLGGDNPRGYHVINILIHLVNSVLVYFLVLLTIASVRGPTDKLNSCISLFSALIFVSHPLQTEAVTYIFQRFVSLSAMFYLSSVLLYIISRKNGGLRILPAFLSIITALLSFLTKESAYTIIFSILLYEVLFFKGFKVENRNRLIVFFVFFFLIAASTFGFMHFDSHKTIVESLRGIGITAESGAWPSSMEYLFTSFRVIVTYLRLLFIPINQNIDYDYPISKDFFQPDVIFSFFLLCGLFAFAVLNITKQKIISFGIFWFFITLSIESSIIPLPMVINEYRMYLPSVGIFTAISYGAFHFLDKLSDSAMRKKALLMLLLVPMLFAVFTYKRNEVWKNRETLWKDVVEKSPKKTRGYNNLGLAYFEKGETNNAISYYRKAVTLDPAFGEAFYNLGNAYSQIGLTNDSITAYKEAIKYRPDISEAYTNLGNVYMSKGDMELALNEYLASLKIKPDNPNALGNIGALYYQKGIFANAVENFQKALVFDPDNPLIHYNLALSLSALSNPVEANKHFEKSKMPLPENPIFEHPEGKRKK